MVEDYLKKEAIFRSAEMQLIQFLIPQELARDSAYTLGKLGNVQMVDLNTKVRNFQRTYVDELRKLDNLQRQYRYFYQLLQNHSINMYEGALERFIDDGMNTVKTPSGSAIEEYIMNANFLEERLLQMETATNQISQQKDDFEQYRSVLKSADVFFDFKDGENRLQATHEIDLQTTVDQENFDNHASVNFVIGVIDRGKLATLLKILWRTLRGNLLFRHQPIEEPIYDPQSNQKVFKDSFIVFSHGGLLIHRIKKVAESLDAKLYDVPTSSDARSKLLLSINQSLEDLYTVLETTTNTLKSELYAISRELDFWYQDISREKSIFEMMNKFNYDSNRRILIAEGWIPTDEIPMLQARMSDMVASLGADVPSLVQIVETNATPPTHHRTNKFTLGFQNICDCYGIAQYGEVNPGLPTIVTFPFMFAIMFGDMGHGLIMTLIALALVVNEGKIGKMKRGEIFDMAFTGRYIVLLMGLFSMYTGFLYNDLFSKSMTIFNSGWAWPSRFQTGDLIIAKQTGVYPMGIDPAWHGADNALLFTNSFKMKLSVLMGFIHMTYSYFFSLVNHLHFRSIIDIVGNFIPGLLFLQGIFGYLSVCIVYKWSKDWYKDGQSPPGLLNMLINMFLAPGKIDEELYPHQAQVQVFLLVTALICIPWLLLVKPLHFKLTHKDHVALPELDEDLSEDVIDDGTHDAAPEAFSDVVIHQVIHTIEFCLNCVSHTASYLRLWALSLAHAQLSSVLWTMTLEIAFGVTGFVGVFMTVTLFFLWFVLTCAVLVAMEGTSAMLHSLRLHWVESMSKFFVGDGLEYQPFKFEYASLAPE